MIQQSGKGEITARRLSEADFRTMRDEWRRLLDASTADPLFMSWEWLSAWWETWREPLGLELFLVGAYRGSELVALAPCFRYDRRLRSGLVLQELHFIGNAWHIAPTVRTEYVDLIVDSAYAETATAAISDYLRACRWDLLVICDHVSACRGAAFPRMSAALHLKRAPRSADVGVRIDTRRGFDDWLHGLGYNTRLKAYNRRRYLEESGAPASLSRARDAEEGLELLNRFHTRRWGKPCFADESLAFHRRFTQRLRPDQRLCMSVMSIGGEPRSILYDLAIDNTVYNLQAGFQEDFDRKVSLGTLHLGYAIEASFADPRIESYDLLAGEGKNTFYKAHFNGRRVSFQTAQYLRTGWLKAASVVYQALPPRLSRPVLRWLDAPVSGRD